MASTKIIEENSDIETVSESEIIENDAKIKEMKLNNYAKKKILNHIRDPNKDSYNLDEVTQSLRCSRTDIENYINNRAKLSQMNVHLECDSPSFQSVNNWLESFEAKGFNKIIGNEIPLLMKSIAILEEHPDPNECGGIIFKQLYQFLSDVMKGEPTNELDEPTRTFLCDIFGELINDVNSDKGDKEMLKIQKAMSFNSKNQNQKKTSRTYVEDTFDLGLDPLGMSRNDYL